MVRGKINKLSPNWEGPYRVNTGSYKLEEMDDKIVLRPWNAQKLNKYYH